MTTLIFDIETDGLLNEATTIWCLGIAEFDSDRSATTSAWANDDVQVYTDYSEELPGLQEGLDRLLAADVCVAHNGIGFDVPALQKLTGTTLDMSKQIDTLVLGMLLEPRRSQHKLASYGNQLGFAKGEHDDWTQYSDDMVKYCAQDVRIGRETYKYQLGLIEKAAKNGADYTKAIELEHKVQQVLALQAAHGFRLDVAKIEHLYAEYLGRMDALDAPLQEAFPPRYRPLRADYDFSNRTWVSTEKSIFTPKRDNKRMGYCELAPLTKIELKMFNPGSRDHSSVRMSQEFGWRPTEFTPTGKPKMSETALAHVDYPEARLMSEYLTLVKKTGQLAGGAQSWLSSVGSDGYVHPFIKSCGARTHRMAHMHPNVAQVDKSAEMRSCWLPDPGEVMVGVDADAIELRLLAAYLFPADGGKYALAVLSGSSKRGTDAHTLNQKAVGLYLRDSAKTFFYAMVYGAGDAKLGQTIYQDAVDAGKTPPKGDLRAIGAKGRKAIESGITGLRELLEALKSRVKAAGFVRLPYTLRPIETPQRIALNSLLQGAGAEVMKMALVLFHFEVAPARGLVQGKDFKYLATVHDEQQFSCPKESAKKTGQAFADALVLAGERLELAVPMAGGYEIGTNWSETH